MERSNKNSFLIHRCLLFGVMALIASSLFFYSCKTPAATIIERHDSLVVYRDTIVTIQQRTDTFYLPSIIIRDTIIVKENKSELRIKISDNKGLQIICKEAELQMKLDSVIKIKSIRHERIETKIVNQCESKWHSFTNYFFFIAFGLIAIYILIKK